MDQKKIGTLHFLVHPGYNMVAAERLSNVKDDAVPDTRKAVETERERLEVYRGKIDSLAQDDVLVIFSPADRKTHNAAVADDREWIRLEKDAREKLGRRCIVLSNPSHLQTEKTQGPTMETVGRLIKGRGFYLFDDTRCEVWGYALASCVASTVEEAFKFLPLNKYPEIPVRATDGRHMRAEEIGRLEEGLRACGKRVKLTDK